MPAATKKEVDENSCSSLVDLLHLKSSTEQSQRSTPSSSRRSSDGRTKPESPDIRKRTASTTASDILMTRPGLPIPHKPLKLEKQNSELSDEVSSMSSTSLSISNTK